MIFRIIIFISLLGIIFSCANQTSPTGGPKDEIPPLLINSQPENQSINFSGSKIILTFDEVIKLNNPTQQVIVTPRIKQEIEFSSKKNKLIIDLKGSLAPNTTYNFNFREAIKDITEGNINPLNFAFSTGPYLDSLTVSGNVYNVLKGIPLNSATVGLQLPSDTIDFFKHPPYYFTTTDKNGDYSFSNVKNADYIVYAFADKNKDLLLQPSLEEYGFIKNPLTLSKDTSQINIPTVKVNLDTLKIISHRQSGKYYAVNFNKPLIDYYVAPINTPLPYMLSDDKRNITFFNIDQLNDSTAFIINAEDSIHYKIKETVYVKYAETVRKPIEFTFSFDPVAIIKSSPSLKTTITFNKPVKEVNFDSVFYFHDSTQIINLDKSHLTFDSSRTFLTINLKLQKNLFTDQEEKTKPANPHLYIGNGAFLSVENDLNTAKKANARIYTDNDLGTIFITVIPNNTNFIVELLNKNYKVIERRYNETEIRMDKLLPENYFLRVIADPNNNKFWDAGNIHVKQTPELIEYYINPAGKKDIILRANFEVGPFEIIVPPVDK